MRAIWAKKSLQRALKGRPNTNKSPNLFTLRANYQAPL